MLAPCATQSCRLGHRGSQGLQRTLEEHNLVAANTWGVRKPATHKQGIDYALLRSTQSGGPGKHCRPIGVIAPEGKILAGALRKRLKPALQTAMQGLPQFGFVPGRGTEEAICKALSHVDEARQRAALIQRSPGRGHQGLQLKGSLAASRSV